MGPERKPHLQLITNPELADSPRLRLPGALASGILMVAKELKVSHFTVVRAGLEEIPRMRAEDFKQWRRDPRTSTPIDVREHEIEGLIPQHPELDLSVLDERDVMYSALARLIQEETETGRIHTENVTYARFRSGIPGQRRG